MMGNEPRAAIYARFSSEMQRDASIADQIRECTKVVKRLAGRVVETFTDKAISGATALRPGYQRLLAAAGDGRFDIVVAESLDRLSRDQEHIAALYKRLCFSGVRIITVADGEINEMHVGLKGTMAALYLKNLGQATKRALEGVIGEGRAAGGRAYGYRTVRSLGADGKRVIGAREIERSEAKTVVRIFGLFASGLSPRAIAKTLNAEGVPGPAGNAWQDTTIRGHHGRGTGILRNRLYIGELVWNRLRYIKDPVTARRVSRPNDPADVLVEAVPHLRIIDQNLWESVQARLEGIRASDRAHAIRARQFWKDRRPKHLLSGKVICGCCGGAFAAVGKDYLACAAARRKGTCNNAKGIRRDHVETLILDALRHQLMQPERVEEFTAAVVAERNRARAAASADRDGLERELAQARRKLAGLIDAIADGLRGAGLQEQLDKLEQRKAELECRLAAPAPPVTRLHPNLAQVYRAKVADLQGLLGRQANTAALEALRALIERVEVRPADGGGHEIELIGDIAAMVELGSNSKKPAPGGAGLLGCYRSSVKVVAGAGFEPATFRL